MQSPFQSLREPDKRFRQPILIGIALFILYALWRLQHWPGQGILLYTSLGLILVFYPLRFWFKPVKKVEDYIKLLLVISFVVSRYLQLMHLPGAFTASIVFAMSFVLWFINDLFQIRWSRIKNWPLFLGYLLSAAAITTGAVLKLIGLNSADAFLVAGFILLFLLFTFALFNGNLDKKSGD